MSLALTLLLAAPAADARPHPICAADLSEVQMSGGQALFLPPNQLEEHALRPGLLHVQAEVCRCLPRRRRHQPDVVRAWLNIALGEGQITVEYSVEASGPGGLHPMHDGFGHGARSTSPVVVRRHEGIDHIRRLETELLDNLLEVALHEDG